MNDSRNQTYAEILSTLIQARRIFEYAVSHKPGIFDFT